MVNKNSTINKNSTRQYTALICLFFLMGALLLGCGASDNQTASSNTTASTKTSEAATTRDYTDYKGHTVNIPTTPVRIAYFGENYGDLLVLDVKAIGTSTSMIEGKVYEKQVQNVADLGFPINLEKTLELQPDLIITADTDEKQYAALTKIAPTIMFDTFAPLNERLLHLGDIVNKKKAAEDWLAQYKIKEAEMWTKLHAEGVKAGETASVFTYYPGDRLFAMGRTGLSQILYEKNGFKPTPLIQKALDEDKGFVQISQEVIGQYAGDRIFILRTPSSEAQQSTEQLMKSKLWLQLPAVKQGRVYTQDIGKTESDASTREWLLEELPKLIK
ncbi:ABC-type Fe3+-hydroxamate transport system substrate-binding protein [Paenibacillus sp. PvR133]|uniref:ABC transporter substrate-binding protein n=1 Tax=Paenibacillus sp. PvR133 TaxID=2806598 RepID=UPI001AE2D264|nr:ABC transporter substrate-binding protein [Paenibacillus sp. PvR133]MBP1175186.1 ABC-type Fe3+-hydroxamate transport system substrate-binding protein [Paenibacillus sp. PvR133]